MIEEKDVWEAFPPGFVLYPEKISVRSGGVTR